MPVKLTKQSANFSFAFLPPFPYQEIREHVISWLEDATYGEFFPFQVFNLMLLIIAPDFTP